jgi:polysaccharide deacetylase family protein (PEP-CTERM system associated)
MVDRPDLALSFDVEEWFQTHAAESGYPRACWSHMESRLAAPMARILSLLSRYGGRATFFFLGWIVERMPDLAERVVREGHELASHGYGHGQITFQDRREFAADLDRAEDAFGRAGLPGPRGYRAPSFTVVSETTWALRELSSRGYRYDSSVYPMFKHRYGFPHMPLRPFLFQGNDFRILELPMAVAPVLGVRLPVAGGAYMRFLPGQLFRALLGRISAGGRTPVMYMHPWELDGGMRLSRCTPLQRIRQETGAGRRAHRKLEAVLRRFRGIALEDLARRSSSARLQRIVI